jgi:glucose-1-phosphate thymidylyltransferase
MIAGIKEFLIITSERDINAYRSLLGNGDTWGIKIEYGTQEKPNGIAEAMLIGEKFLNGSSSALILGDNIFFGNDLPAILKRTSSQEDGATIFAYRVSDPERYGIVSFDESNLAASIEEKPSKPQSNFAITGLYLFDAKAPIYASDLNPSHRGELEITDLNKIYLRKNKLSVEKLGRGIAWFDAGTQDSMMDASIFISTVQKRQGFLIGCLEEIAINNKWIDNAKLKMILEQTGTSNYINYVKNVILGSEKN